MKPIARLVVLSLALTGCAAVRPLAATELATVGDATSGGSSVLRPMPERYVLTTSDAEAHAVESPSATATRATLSP